MRSDWAALVLVVSTGCLPTRFLKSDPTFVEVQGQHLPEVCVEPPRPYREVGTIRVGAAARTAVSEMTAQAQQAGFEVGCDVLISKVRPPHRAAWHGSTRTRRPPEPPPKVLDYICGVFLERSGG